jgi:hypothetical protein
MLAPDPWGFDPDKELRSEIDRLLAEEAQAQADFFAERWEDCKKENQELKKEIDRRPPLNGPILRRLKYLFTGK